MKKTDFYFDLPKELIAQHPCLERDGSRLLLLNKSTGKIEHDLFSNIIDYLRAGDCLVMNDSRVIPARLIGTRSEGAYAELLLLKDLGDDKWECLCRPGRKLRAGASISFGNGEMIAEILELTDSGNRIVRFRYSGVFLSVLDNLGKIPLPPYITEELNDSERYQTVYSRIPGSAAAPTAGLHFTNALMDRIREKGIRICFVTLHVGLGTFRPVKEDSIEDHIMHSEFCIIPRETSETVNSTKREGGRIISVGTTSCRTLESFTKNRLLHAGSAWTDIFIYPGYKFKCVDALITNFHLPESSLIMLVSALAGREKVLKAYDCAIKENYRFFSFGDAMFIH